jgi:hypothetical protein
MSTFVCRLKAPRPTFALDMSDEEREIMARHAGHWRPWVESSQMVIFGPVLDGSGSWGLGVGRPASGREPAEPARQIRRIGTPVTLSGSGSGAAHGEYARELPQCLDHAL